jgi:hypothetical protein
VDARKHDLLISPLFQLFEMLKDLARGKTPGYSSGMRNDAIGTAAITPILDLQKCPRVLTEGMERLIQEEGFLLNIFHLDLRGLASFHEGNEVSDMILLSISEEIVHPFDLRKARRIDLGITSGDNEQGMGIGPVSPSNHLPRLNISPMGHGTGVNNRNISPFTEGNDPVSFFFEGFDKGF